MKRPIRSTITTLALTLAATCGLSATSEAATPGQVTSGEGWVLANADYTTSLAPVTYTVVFDSVEARERLTPYLTAAAAQTQRHTPGTTFTVSTTIQKAVIPGCQALRTIVATLEYQPMGKPGYSYGGNCYRTSDHTLHSGIMRFTTEWWRTSPNWFSATPTTNYWRIMNGVTHEFGHAIGLGHPNRDHDHDGAVEDYECTPNTDGTRPVMCSPNGGWVDYRAGSYTPMDVAGLSALVANYQYR